MPVLTVRNVPPRLYKALRQSAKAHHRSINREVIAGLERNYADPRADPETFIQEMRAWRRRLKIAPVTDEILRQAKEERP